MKYQYAAAFKLHERELNILPGIYYQNKIRLRLAGKRNNKWPIAGNTSISGRLSDASFAWPLIEKILRNFFKVK